jgi:hypothetical protein
MIEIVIIIIRILFKIVYVSDIIPVVWDIIKDVFFILSSIATTSAVVVAIYTLREIQKQRQSIYQPELILTKTNFRCYMYLDDKKLSNTPFVWTTKIIEGNNSKKRFSHFDSPFNINVYNIGLGSAKEIQFKFVNDLEIFIDIIDRLRENDQIIVKRRNNLLNIEYKEIPYEVSYMIENNINKSLDYILPANIENSPYNLQISTMFISLYSIIYHLYFKLVDKKDSFDENEMMLDSFPDLEILMTYKDIGNKQYEKKISLKVVVVAYSNENWDGYLEIENKNTRV